MDAATTTDTSTPSARGNRAAIIVLIIALFAAFAYWTMGVYTVQPIGAIPEGGTVIVWRASGEPFFNSADAVCLKVQGSVSLLCRIMALGKAPTDRIILRLPYQDWAYQLSTGGRTFEK